MSDHPSQPHVAAIILAAGRGLRSGYDLPKQYVDVGGEPLLRRTIRAFQACPVVDLIQVVIHPQDEALYHAAVSGIGALRPPVAGDRTRQVSVLRGLEALEADSPQIVMIHDGARPFVSCELLESVAAAAVPAAGAVPAISVSDTLRRSNGDLIGETVARDHLYAMQTPQAFAFDTILKAHQQALQGGHDDLTDDAAVFQLAGHEVTLVPGERGNIKLTQPDDFAYAELIMSAANEIRTGQGFDVHAFEAGDGVTLCGIQIPFERKLKGHSDADVGLHALTDAIFGAMADGDIGSHFPPSDPQWKGMASEYFLKYAVKRLTDKGGRLVSLDLTLICEIPKVGPHRNAMRERISEICEIAVSRISVKATTSERLGFTGRGEGIAAMAVANVCLPAGQ